MAAAEIAGDALDEDLGFGSDENGHFGKGESGEGDVEDEG
jgi:hypothetical protein